MTGLIGQVLPLAVGAMISPTILAIQVLVLSSRQRPRMKAFALLIGAAVTLAVFGLVVVLLLQSGPVTKADESAPTHGLIYVTLRLTGALLLVWLGVRSMRPKETPGEKHQSRVSSMLATAGAPLYFVVGVVGILIDFSSLVLYIPGLHDIVRSDASGTTKWIAFAILYLFILMPVIVPLLLSVVMGTKADPILAAINHFVVKHGRTINVVVCFVFAAYLAITGLAVFASMQ